MPKPRTIFWLAALALIVGARTAAADEWDWLRVVCAPFQRESIPWWLLRCDRIPDDPASAQG